MSRATLVIVLAATAGWCTLTDPVRVRVINETDGPLRDVHLEGRKIDAFLGELAPSQARSVRVRPGPETSLFVTFVASDGRWCRQDLDLYLVKGIAGSIEVAILGCAWSRVEKRTTVRGW